MKTGVAGILFLLGLFFVNLKQSNAGDTFYSYSIPGVQLKQPVRLGQGFDSRTKTFRQVCFEGHISEISIPFGKLEFSKEHAEKMDYHRMVFEAGLGFSYAGFGGYLNAAMDHSTYYASYQQTIHVDQQATSIAEILDTFRLNAYGARVAAFNDPELFRLSCGDEIVTRIDRGSIIQLVFRLFGDTRENIDKAKAELEVDLGVDEFTMDIFSIDKRMFAQRAYFDVEAVQYGGTSETLKELMARERKPCVFGDSECLKAIQKYLDGWIQYLKPSKKGGRFADDVLSSIQNKDPSSILAVNTTAISTVDPSFQPSYAQSIPVGVRWILDVIDQKMKEVHAAQESLETMRRLGRPHPSEALLIRKLHLNRKILQETRDQCYRQPTKCTTDYEDQLEPFRL